MIYFVRANGTDKVKIGYSKDQKTFKARISSLQTGQPWRLEVLRIVEGGDQWMEGWFHQVFRACHTSGEWFVYNPAMMDLIPDIETLMRRAPRMQARETLEAMVYRLIDILDEWTPDPEMEREADDEPPMDDEPDYAADEEADVDDELSAVEVDV